MTDAAFREPSEPTRTPKEIVEPEDKEEPQDRVETVEPPYLDYEVTKGQPYLVDHFELGASWNDPVGGFAKELSIIEEYIGNEIRTGKIGNDIVSAKEILKQAEKMTNTKSETRPVVKLGVLAEYMKFLMESGKIKYNAQRYANT